MRTGSRRDDKTRRRDVKSRLLSLKCVIGGEFFGCIMYADDLVLVSDSACVLQNMIDICVDELICIGQSFNVKKRFLRFGLRYMRVCELITVRRQLISLHMCIRQDICRAVSRYMFWCVFAFNKMQFLF